MQNQKNTPPRPGQPDDQGQYQNPNRGRSGVEDAPERANQSGQGTNQTRRGDQNAEGDRNAEYEDESSLERRQGGPQGDRNQPTTRNQGDQGSKHH
jgi:hypothetical protein